VENCPTFDPYQQKQVMSHKQLVQFLCAQIIEAKESNANEYHAGLAWYSQAHSLILEMANTFRVHPTKVAGLVAVTSAQKSWSSNVAISYKLLKDLNSGDFEVENFRTYEHSKAAIEKALRVYFAQDAKEIASIFEYNEKGKKLNSFKTYNFWLNLASPQLQSYTFGTHKNIGSIQPVTIDSHIFDLFCMDRKFGSAIHYKKAVDIIEATKKELSKVGINLLSHQVQAILWNVQRSKRGWNCYIHETNELKRNFSQI